MYQIWLIKLMGHLSPPKQKVIASPKEKSLHVLGLKWDHNNDTLVVSRGTSSTVTKSLALGRRIAKRHCWKVPRMECRTTQACRNHYTKELLFRNFEHLKLHMFGDSSQEIFSAAAFPRARVTTSSGPQTELAFILGKAGVAPMKVMTVPKLELQAALLAARLKRDICRSHSESQQFFYVDR